MGAVSHRLLIRSADTPLATTNTRKKKGKGARARKAYLGGFHFACHVSMLRLSSVYRHLGFLPPRARCSDRYSSVGFLTSFSFREAFHSPRAFRFPGWGKFRGIFGKDFAPKFRHWWHTNGHDGGMKAGDSVLISVTQRAARRMRKMRKRGEVAAVEHSRQEEAAGVRHPNRQTGQKHSGVGRIVRLSNHCASHGATAGSKRSRRHNLVRRISAGSVARATVHSGTTAPRRSSGGKIGS